MLPKTAEYGLRAVVWLAREPNVMQSADQIAEATKVPRRYLHKVLQDLVRAELVRSQSGPRGGYALARKPNRIALLDVIDAVGGIQRIRECPLGLDDHSSLCPLHQELDKAYAKMEAAFDRVTVAGVVNRATNAMPLCATDSATRRYRGSES
jgi:Rrf2 family protein